MCGCHLWYFPLSFVRASMFMLSQLRGEVEPGYGTQDQPAQPGPLDWWECNYSFFLLSGSRPKVVHLEAGSAEDVAVLSSLWWLPNRQGTLAGCHLRVRDRYREVLGHSMRMEKRVPLTARTNTSVSIYPRMQRRIWPAAHWPMRTRSTQAWRSWKVHLPRV